MKRVKINTDISSIQRELSHSSLTTGTTTCDHDIPFVEVNTISTPPTIKRFSDPDQLIVKYSPEGALRDVHVIPSGDVAIGVELGVASKEIATMSSNAGA